MSALAFNAEATIARYNQLCDRITIDMYRQQLSHIDLKPFVHQQHRQINIAVDLHIWLRNTPPFGCNRIDRLWCLLRSYFIDYTSDRLYVAEFNFAIAF